MLSSSKHDGWTTKSGLNCCWVMDSIPIGWTSFLKPLILWAWSCGEFLLRSLYIFSSSKTFLIKNLLSSYSWWSFYSSTLRDCLN